MNNASVGNERTIHIRDLFYTLCQRWRSLIICLIIGAVVLGAYGWWKSGGESYITPGQAETMGNNLGQERKGVIESFASEIIVSTRQMIQQTQYNQESSLMQLDPFHLYVYELNYYIDDTAEEETGTSRSFAIAQAYLAKLQENYLGQKVTAVMEGEYGSERKDFYESPQLIQVDKGNLEDGVLTFRLYYSEEGNKEDVNALKEAIQAFRGIVQAEIGRHNMILLGESGFQYADMDIMYMQEANAKRIHDLSERIEDIKKTVTKSEEEKYLQYLIDHADFNNADGEKGTIVKTQRHLSKKYILVGAILGLIVAAIVIIIKYITTNTIKSAKEIEEDFDLQLLGSFEGKSPFYQHRKTKLDQWLRKKKNRTKGQMPAEEMAEVIATKIKIEAEKADLHQICLAVDKKVSDNTAFLDSLMEKIGDNPAVKIIRNIPEQPDGLEVMAGMDGAVLVGQVDRSGFDDLKTICDLCRNYSVKMIGTIVAE